MKKGNNEKENALELERLRQKRKSAIKTAYAYQKKSGWTFNNEREVAETIFHNRFNFLLLAYSLFLNAYFIVENNNDKLTILIIGLIIIFLLSISIFRVYTRFTVLIDILRELNVNEALHFITKELSKKNISKIFPFSVTTGIIIPIVMMLSFIIGIISYILSYFCISLF